jgi:hypothetical protein
VKQKAGRSRDEAIKRGVDRQLWYICKYILITISEFLEKYKLHAPKTHGSAPSKRKHCDFDKRKGSSKRKKAMISNETEDFDDPFDALEDSTNTSSIHICL